MGALFVCCPCMAVTSASLLPPAHAPASIIPVVKDQSCSCAFESAASMVPGNSQAMCSLAMSWQCQQQVQEAEGSKRLRCPLYEPAARPCTVLTWKCWKACFSSLHAQDKGLALSRSCMTMTSLAMPMSPAVSHSKCLCPLRIMQMPSLPVAPRKFVN